MIIKKRYKGIADTMQHLKIQIIDSIDFALIEVPEMEDPEELFYWLKERTSYKNDFKGVELLQSMQTLFNKNCHGIPGAGDCDCFTITAVAAMIAQDWNNIYIDLVGRDKLQPVHIYASIDWRGKRQVFDLTNREFNYERSYPYHQQIKVNWRNW